MAKPITLEDLVNEGLASDESEMECMLEDMGITLEEVNEGKWY
jgi:hypothetical protein